MYNTRQRFEATFTISMRFIRHKNEKKINEKDMLMSLKKEWNQ